MCILVIVFLLTWTNVVLSRFNYDDRPRIFVRDGHLTFEAPPYKNITFKTSKNSGVSINDVDVLTTLNKAQNATKLTDEYKQTLATYTDRLEVLEEKVGTMQLVGEVPAPTNTSSPISNLLVRKLSRKVTVLQKTVNILKQLIFLDECQNNPCKNGGTCQDLVGKYHCQCLQGWQGKDCDLDVNECVIYEGTDLGCQNGGKCLNRPGSYECDCPAGFAGIHCLSRKVDCLTGSTEMCGHGTCVNQNSPTGYKCICDQGWKTDGTDPACKIDVDECSLPHPSCSVNPKVTCVNVPGSFYCSYCPEGFTGNGYQCHDIDECATNNGGCSTNPLVTCINTHGSRVCGLCPPGYSGDGTSCTYQGVCNVNNGGCHPLAKCTNNPSISSTYVECTCPPSYVGNGIGPQGCTYSADAANPCHSNPCKNGNCSVSSNGSYKCTCNGHYIGRNCDVLGRDPCSSNPCMNGGVCQNVANMAYKCACKQGYSGELCNVEQEACGGFVKSTEGTIKFPQGNFSTYNHRINCAFTVTSNVSSKVLQVTFTKFDLEESPGCNNDWLEIHDGRNTAAPTIGRFCGSALPMTNGSFTSTYDSLYFWFRSNANVAKGGFELTWKAIPWQCGEEFDNKYGSIQSPGAPANYPLSRDCWWRFKAPAGKRFLFSFHTLNIGPNVDCSQDLIQFFTMLDYMRANDRFIRICNSTLPEPFYSPGNTALMHFHSNGKDAYPGFQMNYVVVEGIPGCGGVFSNKEGYIQSPHVNQLYACEYKILQPPSSRVQITFESFEFSQEDCDFNYLEIFDGPDEKSPSAGKFCKLGLPGPYISTGNSLTIVADAMYTSNWKLKYERLCLQKFTNESGTFSASAFYDRYGSTCVYQIERPPGEIIELLLRTNFQFVGFTRFPECSYIYVEIRDGDNENSTLMGKYCEDKTYNFTSTHNALYIKVYSYRLHGDTSNLFKAEYTSVNTGCGGILKERFGHIASPIFAEGVYPIEQNCKWTIIAPPGNIISLSWPKFHIEQSYECSYDYLKIFDNNTDFGTGEEIGKYCGYTTIPTVTSTSNVMTILFYSDNTISEGGFLASYMFLDQENVCTANYMASSGVIKSPGYPNEYLTNQDCIYTITIPVGQQILLNVTDFHLEEDPYCKYDKLTIRNGGTSSSPLIGNFCGETIPKQIWSHTNKLYLHFHSDVSKSTKGFLIYWSTLSTGCGGTLTSSSGSIISPNYPEPYNKNTECLWKIIVSKGSTIRVVFADLDLENSPSCIADYLEVYDDVMLNSKSLGRFCTGSNATVQSSNNKMMVKFKSDINFQGRGFKLNYITDCWSTLKGFRGIIESLNFPNNYPFDQTCIWEIHLPSKNKLNITFSHFEMEHANCTADYLEIQYYELNNEFEVEEDTFNVFGRYCGSENPGHLSIDSNRVRIKFVVDNVVSYAGFRLEWQNWGCGGHIKKNVGSISSPNYPNGYPKDIVCEWLIEVDYGNSIVIEFTDIDIEITNNCDFDYIKLYNGIDDSYQEIASLCNQKNHSVLLSTGNLMFIRFTSDYSLQKLGFTANFNSTPTSCGGHLKSEQGSVFSPNYPQNYNKNETCEWLIEVHDTDSVLLDFKDIDIVGHNCSKNYVKVFDGPSAAYPVLATVCGSENEKPNGTIRSTYNHMFVEFRSESLLTSKGFLAKYKKACGSRIVTQSSGIIESGPNQYEICIWTIVSVDPTKHVSLVISHMQGMDYCEYYADENAPITIYNGESTDSPVLKSFCGSKLPTTSTSGGNALTLEIQETFQIVFAATYSVYDNHCGGTLMAENGFFATPGYPDKYPSGVQCEWIIQVSAGNHLSINFAKFDLPETTNCSTDYLEIRSMNSSGRLLGYFCGTNIPNNLTHTGDLWMLFKSAKLEPGDNSVQATGFLAEFTLDKKSDLFGSEGLIYSPLYPRSYLKFDTFSYKITVRIGKRVRLSFKEFDLVSDFIDMECDYVYIQVYDGVDATAEELGKFCGLTPPDPVMSSSNIMYITANYINPKDSKYVLEWMEITDKPNLYTKPKVSNRTCGSKETIEFTDEKRLTITSPSFPYGYSPNLKCEWTFSTIPMNHIEVVFKIVNFDFNMVSSNCKYVDHVTVSHLPVNSNDWIELQQICKIDQIDNVIVGSNLVKLNFTTNSFLNGTGFKAEVYEMCGGHLTASTGFISVGGKNISVGAQECQWNITVRSTRKIKIEFEYLEIPQKPNQVCDNYIMVKNGKFSDSPFLGLGKYCGTELPESLESTGNNLYLKFKGIMGVGGFRLKYQEIKSSCGGNIVMSPFKTSIEEISSPNYPNIPQAHTECDWIIHGPPGERLKIDFEERFDLTLYKDCAKEYVEIRDGGTAYSPLIGRFCKSAPNTQYSTDNMMFVRFFTDTDEPKNGFKAKISLGYCGGTIRGLTGGITFNAPADNIKEPNCTWHLVGPVDHYLVMNLTKTHQGCLGNLTVFEKTLDGNASKLIELENNCGLYKTYSFTSSNNEVTVIYNDKGQDKGSFNLQYYISQSKCGGTVEAEAGEISSPGYPGMNFLNRNCLWKIIVPEGRRITAEFLDLDLSPTSVVFEQSIHVMDGVISQPLQVFFGKTPPKSVKSSANKMLVYLVARNPSNNRGFKLKFSSDEPSICTGDFNQTAGSFQSPRVGNVSYSCEWIHLKPNPATKETLAITFDITGETKPCSFSRGITVASTNIYSIIAHFCTHSKKPIIVRSPLLLTKLWISTISFSPFDVSVSYKTHPCGGILTDQSGYLESPKIESSSKSFECAWLIKVPEGERINVTVVDVNLGDDCEKSFLSIYNGELPTAPRIEKFCRNTKPENSIISEENVLWLEYRWEKGSTGKEIKLKYETYGGACGGTFHFSKGTIQTPNYNYDYPNNAECLWDLYASPGYAIHLRFTSRFHLEEATNCENDFLEIFDYVDENWISLGKKCGRDTPADVISASNKLRLLFRSNNKITANGFKAEWNWTCGGTFIASQKPRYIVSPGYPNEYKDNLNCVYNIKPAHSIIYLNFLDFDLEDDSANCEFDNVTIRSPTFNPIHQRTFAQLGSTTFCGKNKPPAFRYSGSLRIIFRTDDILTRTGFKLMYRDESCGGNVTEEGLIETEDATKFGTFLGLYMPWINCEWKITAPPGKLIILDIIKLGLSSTSCASETFAIYKSHEVTTKDRLAKLCGKVQHLVIPSDSGKMLIKLNLYPRYFSGFQAEIRFTHGPAEGCGGSLDVNNTIYINAPNLEKVDCNWKLIAPKDYKLEIKFLTLNLPQSCSKKDQSFTSCDCSFIEIRDGYGPFAEKIEKICSNTSYSHENRILTTSANIASLNLFSYGRSNNVFKAEITPKLSICGHSSFNVTTNVQTMTSPNYPLSYPANTKCRYVFQAAVINSPIKLHFVDFHMSDEAIPQAQRHECTGDTVSITEDPNKNLHSSGLGPSSVYNGGGNTYIYLMYNPDYDTRIFCGKEDFPFDFYSSQKFVILSLNSLDRGTKGKGFKVEYSLADCNRNYTDLYGRILVQTQDKDCEFYIEVPKNRTISLTFLKFTIRHINVNCTLSGFEVKDESASGHLLSRACGYRLPSPIFSNSNRLYLHSYQQQKMGFVIEMSYTSTLEGRGCGGEIYDAYGKIYSPLYPEPFRNDTTCKWIIRGPIGQHIILKFQTMDIQGSCSQTYIEVKTYTKTSPVAAVVCKDTESTLFRSDSSIEINYVSSIHNGGAGWLAIFKSVAQDLKTSEINFYGPA